MSVVMKVAYDGDAHILTFELLDNGGDRGSSFVVIYSDSNQLGTGTSQGRDLLHSGGDVGGIGVGHRLHHNWCIGAYTHSANRCRNGFPTLDVSHAESLV